MSRSNTDHKESHTETRDIYTESRQSFEKIRGNIEKTMPPYVQSMANLSQEYFAAWTNFVSSAMANQQEFTHQMGFDNRTPEASAKIFHDITDGIVKAIDVQSKVLLAVLDAARQTTKAVSDTTNSFSELNHNIVNSWVSTWQKRN